MKNRRNCGAKSKLLVAIEFIDYACKKILEKGWSPDAVVGHAKLHTDWKDNPLVSTKTLYNYIDQSKLSVRNIDLPMKTKLSTKTKRIRKHRRVLGKSIAERPAEVEDRVEFGHWEIDTVEGQKSDDNALLTIIERKSRFYYAVKIDDQDHDSVDYAINKLQHSFGDLFPQVFKTITSANGSEFSDLSSCLESITDVYFARPYASYERGSNEKHTGLLRRYIPKGQAVSDYSRHAIEPTHQTLHNLTKTIFNYQQPVSIFEKELDTLA